MDLEQSYGMVYTPDDAFAYLPNELRQYSERVIGERCLYNPFVYVHWRDDETEITPPPSDIVLSVEEWPTIGMLEGLEEQYIRLRNHT